MVSCQFVHISFVTHYCFASTIGLLVPKQHNPLHFYQDACPNALNRTYSQVSTHRIAVQDWTGFLFVMLYGSAAQMSQVFTAGVCIEFLQLHWARIIITIVIVNVYNGKPVLCFLGPFASRHWLMEEDVVDGLWQQNFLELALSKIRRLCFFVFKGACSSYHILFRIVQNRSLKEYYPINLVEPDSLLKVNSM